MVRRLHFSYLHGLSRAIAGVSTSLILLRGSPEPVLREPSLKNKTYGLTLFCNAGHNRKSFEDVRKGTIVVSLYDDV